MRKYSSLRSGERLGAGPLSILRNFHHHRLCPACESAKGNTLPLPFFSRSHVTTVMVQRESTISSISRTAPDGIVPPLKARAILQRCELAECCWSWFSVWACIRFFQAQRRRINPSSPRYAWQDSVRGRDDEGKGLRLSRITQAGDTTHRSSSYKPRQVCRKICHHGSKPQGIIKLKTQLQVTRFDRTCCSLWFDI